MIYIVITTAITMLLLGLGFGYFIAYNRDKNYQKLEKQYEDLNHMYERDINKHIALEKELRMIINDTYTNKSIQDLKKVISIIENSKNRKEE